MAVQEKKLRTFYVMDILLEKTDNAGHMMTAAQLMKELEKREIKVDRKTIYNDLDTLREYGLDIQQSKGSNPGYYIGKREFELPEIKLLIDAVQSSKFISKKKSDELIRKLKKLGSEGQTGHLWRQISIFKRVKSDNETSFNNVDALYTALDTNYQVSFLYSEWTVKKKLQLKRNGERYVVSPWAMTWDDENYYLVAYDKEADRIKHFRVDKMSDVQILSEKREGKKEFTNFDLASFSKKTFGMFGGRDEKVSLYCKNYLAGVVLDRFGTDIMMVPKGPEHFQVHVDVAVSPQFFGWVSGIGKDMRISGPENVIEDYRKHLENILEEYK